MALVNIKYFYDCVRITILPAMNYLLGGILMSQKRPRTVPILHRNFPVFEEII
jgi:hypothetical protein